MDAGSIAQAAAQAAPLLLAALAAPALQAAVPRLSGAITARKDRNLAEWWEESRQDYVKFKAENGREPESGKVGKDEAGAALWRDDVRRMAALGNLDRGRAEAAVAAGVLAETALESACANPVEKKACTCGLPMAAMAAAAFALVLAFSPLAGERPGPAPAAVLGAGIVLAACAAWSCDEARLIIPWECSAALLACGAGYQYAIGGAEALASACAMAAITWAAFALTCKADKALHGRTSVGAGDVRFAPAAMMACGPAGAVVGLAAAAAALAATQAADKRARPDAGPALKRMLPMGPTLSCWAIAGTAAAPLLQAAL